jgi:hypothetical protein
MADTGIYATTLQIQEKAGVKASAVSKAEAYTNSYIAQAEAHINVGCNKIFAVDAAAFTALPVGIKAILTEAASNLAAIYVINYDLSGFSTRTEAEVMINVLYQLFNDCMKILQEKSHTDFVK